MSNISVSLSRESIGQMVTRLRDFLSAGGTALKQTHGYEAVARVFGYRNWNTLEAAITAASRDGTPSVEASALAPKADEKDEQPERRPTFECVVTKWIADERWGGALVKVTYRGNTYNIEHGDEVLFRHRDEMSWTVYLRDEEMRAVHNEVGGSIDTREIAKSAIQHLIRTAGFFKFRLDEGEQFYAGSAPTARPVARWKNPPPRIEQVGD